MPRVVITHAVADIQRWLQGKAERETALASIGGNVVDAVALDGSNQIAVSADVDDLEALTEMLTSPPPELTEMLTSPPPELAELMEKHGVIPPFMTYVEK
jgi:hypothetical protein